MAQAVLAKPDLRTRRLRTLSHLLALLAFVYAVAYLALLGSEGGGQAGEDSEWGRSQQHMTGAAAATQAPPATLARPLRGALRRHVLALYDGSERTTEGDGVGKTWETPVVPANSPIHTYAELALNHLGLVVEYADLGELPTDAVMNRYLGIVSWAEDGRCEDPEHTLRWLGRQARAGRRVVLLDGLPCEADLKGKALPPEVIQAAIGDPLEIEIGTERSWDSSLIELGHESGRRTAFERPLDRQLPHWRALRAGGDEARSWLGLQHRGRPGEICDAVFTNRRGGFALREYTLREDRVGERYVRRWQIDPFAFFAEALAIPAESPRLDFTTLNGSRTFYAHVDGDGFGTLSELDHHKTCAEMVREQLFEGYDLPVTSSVVVGRIQPPPAGKGSEKLVRQAQGIFALPNVETASHGLAHPMDWRAGAKSELSVPDLPGYTLSGEAEILRSSDYIDKSLSPPGKPVRVMLWTGWCNPTETQLALAWERGLYNLNGGDGRMDRLYPSYAHLAPPVRRVGERIQVHSSTANDYILTDRWTPPYYRVANVVDTWANSGSPRRVLPVNLYYHFYVRRKSAALSGIKVAYDWVLRRNLAPIFASEYVEMVLDFLHARVARVGPRMWRVKTAGHLRTVRFDGPPVFVDMERSQGVLGSLFVSDVEATYVHLAGNDASVALSAEAPKRPYLQQASHRVEAMRVKGQSVDLELHGVGTKKVWLAGMRPGGAYAARVGEVELNATADAAGVLALQAPGNGRVAVQVRPR